jgi:hypothetical protein
MAFLLQKHNLADLKSICEAQNNLGLKNMAYQCKDDVHITGGNIEIDFFKLDSQGNNVSNYTLAAIDNNGTIGWKQIPNLNVEWINDRNQNQIALSLFSNDLDYVKSNEFEDLVWREINEYNDKLFNDTFINSNLYVHGLILSNLIIHDPEHLSQNPALLTNNGIGSNFGVSEIIQSYSNTSTTNVPSANALNDLYLYIQDVETTIPTENNRNTLDPDSNLSDLENSNIAIRNLGLNQEINTKNISASNITVKNTLTLQNLTSYNGDNDDNGGIYDIYKLLIVNPNDTINSHDLKISQNAWGPGMNNQNIVVSGQTLYYVKTELSNNISECLSVSNVLSEIFSVSNLKDELKQRLTNDFLKEVAFSADYEHLINRITSVSSLCNDADFISAFCNLSDIPNKHDAKSNLELHKVATSGDFNDLENVDGFTNLYPWLHLFVEPERFPFLQTHCNLGDILDTSQARSNLDLKDMAEQDSSNVNITGGIIENLSNLIIHESNLIISPSNTDLLKSTNLNYVVLRGKNSDGGVEWFELPNATEDTFGLCKITCNIEIDDENTTLSVNAIRDSVINNLQTLMPEATTSSQGVVRTFDLFRDYVQDDPNSNMREVLNMKGTSNLYNDLRTNIKGYDYTLTDAAVGTYDWTSVSNDWTIETELDLVTTGGVSNYVQKRLEDTALTFSEITLTNLRVTSEMFFYPKDSPLRDEVVDSNMYMTIMDAGTGEVTFSQIHGVGSNTGIPNETSLEIGKFWRILCDNNIFSIQKRNSDAESYVTKHIFS